MSLLQYLHARMQAAVPTTPFRIPGKNEKKAGELLYWGCCNTIITNQRCKLISLYLILVGQKTGLPGSSSQNTCTFLKNIEPSQLQLLICDWHGSHDHVEFLELAKENDIIVVNPKPHQSVETTRPIGVSVLKMSLEHYSRQLYQRNRSVCQ